ncbi:101aa long hypothetical protein [Pyrococcus horikoshii OT3]|uniref:Uncharacterized protein n=1 Tax=Pyrococcus horikoshii (strain ATCC 700860 / DSM 12428 / JCM 9974 / NBRC 100139 / OT-3) TaxID=70601 RepID=O59076_PYRHO|nr:101aa long hypothetical protein [Pyrococcus horikoshii OT3]
MPSSFTILLISPLSFSLTFASRLLRGSSRSSTSGSITRALARATLCCCPPLSSSGSLFSNPLSPTKSRTSLTLFSISILGTRLTSKPKATFLNTVIWGKRA